MRLSDVRTTALVLGLGLGAAALAHGDDPAPRQGNWFTRLFAGPAAKKDADVKKDEKAVPTVPPSLVRSQAKADLLRRLEVCDRLREIAFQNSDEELSRRADQLEQRAWDAHSQQLSKLAGGSNDERVLQERLGPEAVGPRSLSMPKTKSEGRAAVEKHE